MNDAASEHAAEADDSWAQVLAKIEAERGKTQAQEVTGRGAKRKAAPSFLPRVGACFPDGFCPTLTDFIAKPRHCHWIGWFEC